MGQESSPREWDRVLPCLPIAEAARRLTHSEQGSSKHLSTARKPEFGYPKDEAPRPGVVFAVPTIGKRRRRAKCRYPWRGRSAAQEDRVGRNQDSSFAA